MSTATNMLAAYLAAESAILLNKEYQLNGRRVTRQDLPAIQKGRLEWEQRVSAENAAKSGHNSMVYYARFDS